MANEEQVERLKRGIDEWNDWLQANPGVSVDLSGADLVRVDLSGANLKGANLRRANLYAANLSGANLREANLIEVQLGGANLSGANLSGADLQAADLSGAWLDAANLYEANLRRAKLNAAHLNGADLLRAKLSSARLSGADLLKAKLHDADLRGAWLNAARLSRADFSRARLDEANLSGARLDETNLHQADLRGAWLDEANFTRSIFDDTLFTEVDLSTVQGLESAKYRGPSIVNINSVILPHDEPTRRHFLLGAGFTETQIDYLPSLLAPRPLQYHSLFISYAHEDEAIAQQLHTDLRKKDVPCWFAPHDLRPGDYYRKHIDQAIHMQDKVLLLLSEYSVESGWVEHEVEVALRREIRQKREILFPLRLDDAIFSCTAEWAMSLKDLRHIGDFTVWQEKQRYQESFALLLRHLKTEPSPPPNDKDT